MATVLEYLFLLCKKLLINTHQANPRVDQAWGTWRWQRRCWLLEHCNINALLADKEK